MPDFSFLLPYLLFSRACMNGSVLAGPFILFVDELYIKRKADPVILGLVLFNECATQDGNNMILPSPGGHLTTDHGELINLVASIIGEGLIRVRAPSLPLVL
jgi:hypothetical protein